MVYSGSTSKTLNFNWVWENLIFPLRDKFGKRVFNQKSISIAAASIIAKVYRDYLMLRLYERYRKYHWILVKGMV